MDVDINCDIGEGFGRWKIADDKGLMPYITSANIAAGFHAGDPQTIHQTVTLAKSLNVAVGVHNGFRDLEGFGRRMLQLSPDEIVSEFLYQLGAVREFASFYNLEIQHVKPHGALYMLLGNDESLSRRFIEILGKVKGSPILLCTKKSAIYEVAKSLGYPAAIEFYADREYNDNGQIEFTRGVIDQLDPERFAKRVVNAITNGNVVTSSGKVIQVDVDTVCIHSDTPNAVVLVKAIHDALISNGILPRRLRDWF